MIKKIIHLADIHIRTYRLHEEYKDVFRTFIGQVKELVKDYSMKYREAIKFQTAKIKYALFLLESKGVDLDTLTVDKD